MSLRDGGVTGAQVVMVCGAPQNNHRRAVLARGMFKRDMTTPNTEQGHTVYKLNLTAKGEAAVKKATANGDGAAVDKPKASKASKAKVARKARTAKVTPAAVEAPVSDVQAPAQVPDTAPAVEATTQA